jgi:hypothetical protein
MLSDLGSAGRHAPVVSTTTGSGSDAACAPEQERWSIVELAVFFACWSLSHRVCVLVRLVPGVLSFSRLHGGIWLIAFFYTAAALSEIREPSCHIFVFAPPMT